MADLEEKSQLFDGAQCGETEFFRTLLIGLSIDCPLEKKLDKCLWQDKRSLSFDSKVDWAQSLTDKTVLDLYAFHHKCFHSKG